MLDTSGSVDRLLVLQRVVGKYRNSKQWHRTALWGRGVLRQPQG